MKVAFIGLCGHSMQAYETLRQRTDIIFCGIAPGSDHEQMSKSFDPSIPFFSSWESLLDQTHPHLAIVSPVFGLTGEIIIECAKRGINVFSEKPVAGTLEELERVKTAVKTSGIRFCAMHYLRVSPAFWQGAAMVRGGAIGEVRLLNAQKSYRFGTRPDWYQDRTLFTGIIPWVGIHAIDWIYAFTGKKFLSVNASCAGSPERTALFRFDLENEISASVSLDYFRPETAPTHDDDRIRCVGTTGILEVREGKIHLMNADGVHTITPEPAPELLSEFLAGNPLLSSDEIFYLTRVALLARESADIKQTISIGE